MQIWTYLVFSSSNGPGKARVCTDELWSLGLPEYFASGHHTAHAEIRLWGASPSNRESINTISLYHHQVIQ